MKGLGAKQKRADALEGICSLDEVAIEGVLIAGAQNKAKLIAVIRVRLEKERGSRFASEGGARGAGGCRVRGGAEAGEVKVSAQTIQETIAWTHTKTRCANLWVAIEELLNAQAKNLYSRALDLARGAGEALLIAEPLLQGLNERELKAWVEASGARSVRLHRSILEQKWCVAIGARIRGAVEREAEFIISARFGVSQGPAKGF